MPVQSLSIVIPCLNESETISACVNNAHRLLSTLSLTGEVIVADNGSTDGSPGIAKRSGAEILEVKERGYGATLHQGILHAKSDYVLFADGDESYHFSEAGIFIDAFNRGFDVVIGNRYKGGIQKGAMPWLHQYVGTPILSLLGKKSFHVDLGDFNCGMRGIKRTTYDQLDMKSGGMEYATEFIAKAAYKKCRITEVPVALYRDGRKGKPHLKTWSDGWKHLKLILLLSPKWFLLYPAFFFFAIGSLLGVSLSLNEIVISHIVLDIHTLYFCSVFMIISLTFLQFYCMVNYYGMSLGIYPHRGITRWISVHLNFEKGVLIGLLLFLTGIALSAAAVFRWYKLSFQSLNPQEIFRIIIPGGFCMIAGLQLVVFSFFLTMIKSNH
ncbi:MAG: glycosyltransferase family 2 protein [Chitinophagales bacterium]